MRYVGEQNNLKQNLYILTFDIFLPICIGNSMICSDIWHKYHKWYFKIVKRNFTSQ